MYTQSARHEYTQVLLAAGILMMTDASDKVDAILSERLTELYETQLQLAYQLLLHASGVLEACLESMTIPPRYVGATFTDLGGDLSVQTASESLTLPPKVPDDDTMVTWRQEQLQAPDTKEINRDHSNKLVTQDLALLKRVPDLADGHFPQLLAWIALAEAQELVVLRGVTRDVVDFFLMAKMCKDISTRYNGTRTRTVSLGTYATDKAVSGVNVVQSVKPSRPA